MTQEKALTLVEITNEITEITKIVSKVTNPNLEEMERAVNMAIGIEKMKRWFSSNTQLQTVAKNLASSSLGFKTDKQYNDQIINNCCIEALLNGYRLTGNEFNIIAGNFYPAKAGKFRKIIETPTLINFREHFGKITQGGKTATVEVSASWELKGKEDNFKGEVIVKTNSYSDADNILGKAQSKLYSRVLTRLTGTFVSDGDVEVSKGKVEIVQPEKPKGELKKPDVAEQEPSDPKKVRQEHEENPIDAIFLEGWNLASDQVKAEWKKKAGVDSYSKISEENKQTALDVLKELIDNEPI